MRPRKPIRRPISQHRFKPKKIKNRLYFIGILPPPALSQQITQIKQEFADTYGPQYALRILPHITLQNPFKAPPTMEGAFFDLLTSFAATQKPFQVRLNGFGCFPNKVSPVIFINVELNDDFALLHKNLMNFLRKEFGFSHLLARSTFSPHLTIAYKDMTPEQFERAWTDFEHRPFEATFDVNHFYFLRHDGRGWEILEEFLIGSDDNVVAGEAI